MPYPPAAVEHLLTQTLRDRTVKYEAAVERREQMRARLAVATDTLTLIVTAYDATGDVAAFRADVAAVRDALDAR